MVIGCKQCGTYGKHEPCEKCGVPIHIGSAIQCPHERVSPSKGFEPFFSISLGEQINGIGDIKKACRPKWENDYVVHLQEKR